MDAAKQRAPRRVPSLVELQAALGSADAQATGPDISSIAGDPPTLTLPSGSYETDPSTFRRKHLYNTWLQKEAKPETLALDQYAERLYTATAKQERSGFSLHSLQRPETLDEDRSGTSMPETGTSPSGGQLFTSDWYAQQIAEMQRSNMDSSQVAAKPVRWRGSQLILQDFSWRHFAGNLKPGRLGRNVGDMLGRFHQRHLSSRENLKRLLLFAFGVTMLALALFVWPFVVIIIISADRYRHATPCSVSMGVTLYTTAVLWLSVGGYGLILVAFTRIAKRPVEATGLAGIIGAAVLLSYFLSLIITEAIFIVNAVSGKTPFGRCGPDCTCSAAAVASKLPCCSNVLWWTDLVMLLVSNAAAFLLCCLPYFTLLRENRRQRAHRRAPRYFVQRPAAFWSNLPATSWEERTKHHSDQSDA